jgi:hypothetical protein
MRRLRIHAEAANEAAEAAAWYEKERPGLGEDFFRAVDAALDLLEEEIVPLVALPGAAGCRCRARERRRGPCHCFRAYGAQTGILASPAEIRGLNRKPLRSAPPGDDGTPEAAPDRRLRGRQ